MAIKNNERKTIVDLSHTEALEFFMKHSSYCGTLDFPPYISFDLILKKVNSLLDDESKNGELKDDELKKKIQVSLPAEVGNINHTIFQNKDGKYAWRPIQLTHPVLYMFLVRAITKEEHWKTICKRFECFKKYSHIECMSLPVKLPKKKKKSTSEQILSWWETEQEAIKKSLDYEYLSNIDISNCYGSIYTHSIPWALHGKKKAKKNRGDKKLIGNIIDKHLRDISYGQTNGIPQGSVLMDFISEMVLGYIDCEITKKINDIKNYHIIRYRDDYRIFTKNITDGKKIIKIISEILIKYGMSLNPNKTKISDQVIQDSIKPDKLHWIQQKQKRSSFQKQLIFIHSFSKKFPNSGSLKVALMAFYDKIKKAKKSQEIKERAYQLISIIVDIAYHNPVTYQISAPIISQLIEYINKKEQTDIINKIKEKFKSLPNTGYLDIWLQRVLIGFNEYISFEEPICKIVDGEKNISIWKNDWLNNKFKKKIEDKLILDKEEMEKVQGEPIARDEFELFPNKYQ